MLFNSFPFLFAFLPIVLFVATRLKGQPLLIWISVSSYFFYACAGHTWFLIPMLVTTILDFFLAPRIAKADKLSTKRSILLLSLCGNLGLLFYFKYWSLISNTFHLSSTPIDLILPAGISFYTFQTLAYMIDVYKGVAEPEKNFWKFSGFVSFFPHLVAGPLTRHNQLIPPLSSIARTGIKPLWTDGIFLFSVGLCKKILIADQIARFSHRLFGDPSQMSALSAWMALLSFTLQIYFDFSAYSDMAIGLGRLFGIELPKNFNSPYQAINPSDFWKRWHITLSSWLRDYLYISLGGNRCSHLRMNLNLMATMVLGGLWHGANWTFAIWGFYHGSLLIIYHSLEKPWSKLPKTLQKVITFFLVSFGWIFFRAETTGEAIIWIKKLFSFESAWTFSTLDLNLGLFLCLGMILIWVFPNASSNLSIGSMKPKHQRALALATAVAIMMMNYTSKFLYFQF